MKPAGRHWRRHDDPQGIVWLWLDKAGERANTLSREVLIELAALLDDLHLRTPRGVVIASAKESGFILGADIREFLQLTDEHQAFQMVREAQAVIDRLATLPCPTIAMIRGYALGGGLELAMACRYRVCAAGDKSTLGLPEVQLGIHPGFGGTVRSVQLMGPPAALNLFLTGRPLRPKKARALGLIDQVVPDAGEALEDAARRLIQRPPPPRRAPWHLRVLNLPGIRNLVARRVLRQVARNAKKEHYPAPYAALELWRQHGAREPVAFEAEAQSIARLFLTPTSQNLVRVFFLRERLKKLGEAGSAFDCRHVHVVGAGVMGGDIAAWCAQQGLTVTLQDRDPVAVEKARERARQNFSRRLPPTKVADILERFAADPHGDGIRQADVVVEAIFEDLAAKRELFRELERKARPDALLASNTSSIRLEEIASVLVTPERLIGLHFFNPVAQMPLVEVIRGHGSHKRSIQHGLAFARRIDKLPLPCESRPGFLVNRILMPYLAEACQLVAEGVPLERIDAAARDFGMPMGPIELADSVGLDVVLQVAEILGAAFDYPVPEALRVKVNAGHLGRKTGQGFYVYRDGKPLRNGRRASPESQALPDDLQDRLILPMINEAVACLGEGVVEDADLIDAGVIFGAGFAPFRGGPLHYARSRGTAAVVQQLGLLAMRHGGRFQAHPGWSSLEADF